jgi:hypothetical protein
MTLRPTRAAALLLLLCAGVIPTFAVPQRPDFSGRWTFDREKSARPGPDGRIVIAPMLGDEFVARQDATTLTLEIKAGALTVTAVYRLDGVESRNMSPGANGEPDILVTSRATWEGDTLVILSKSSSIEKGRAVTIDTQRVLYLENGDLVLERTGTPPEMVKWSRSVYRRAK